MPFSPENYLFIDIETVSSYPTYEDCPLPVQAIWKKKYERNEYLHQYTLEKSYESKAAIFAEYGKIICVSMGIYDKARDEYRIKSYYGHEEKILLEEFAVALAALKKNYQLCGHNIKEFDIPYLCRRFLICQMPIPKLLNFQDKKPWEIELLDTLQLWKFGDYKNYTSLETLTTIFDIPSPKEDIDGGMVGHVYWIENNLERIVEYCQQDVIALIQVYCRLSQMPLIHESQFQIISSTQ